MNKKNALEVISNEKFHYKKTHINGSHGRVGHVGALHFEFWIQPKRDSESHVKRRTEVHETGTQIVEDFLSYDTIEMAIISLLDANHTRLMIFLWYLQKVIVEPDWMCAWKEDSRIAGVMMSSGTTKLWSSMCWTL